MVHARHALHIVIVVPGSSPAAAVERALAYLGREGRMPHEIHVIATARQLDIVRRLLSGDGASRISQLCVAAGFPRDEIVFNGRTLHAMDDHFVDVARAVDRTLQRLGQLTAAPGASVTALVSADAGVAGHILHAALRIVAGPQDRLLLDVTPPAARRRGSREPRTPDPVYAEFPLMLWPANEPIPASFGEAVRARRLERQRLAQPDPLRLDLKRRVAMVGDTHVALPAMQFFWLWYLASEHGERFPLAEIVHALSTPRRTTGQVTQKLASGRVRTFPADLQRAFVQLFPLAPDKFDDMYRRACGPQPGLPSTISKINAALRRALGRGAAPYLIQGGRGAGGYRVTLPASAIQIVEGRRA